MDNNRPRRALVLSGGSIKGAFQAGAVCELLRRGFVPDAIYGISVGALNGAFLANSAGEAALSGKPPEWPQIGQALRDFWHDNITEPKKIARPRRGLGLAYDILFSDFEGLVDTKPLRDLIRKTIKFENLLQCPVIFKVGTVNMASGELFIADRRHQHFLDYIIASTAIPVIMPLSIVDKAPLTDGGVRDVAMLGQAVDNGASEVVCILCQPETLSAVVFNHKNLISFASRLMDIIVNETVNNDIEMASLINKFCPPDGSRLKDGPFAGKRRIEITVIRPAEDPALELDDFDRRQILETLEMGRFAACEMAHRNW